MRVLLVSPEPALQRRVQVMLDRQEAIVVAAGSPADARRKLRAERYDAMVWDARRPREREALQRDGTGPVIAVLEPDDVDGMQHALEQGVDDVIARSALEPLLWHRLCLLTSTSQPPERTVPDRPKARAPRPGMRKRDVLVGESAALVAVLRQMDMVAKSDFGVLITGETGTGKELIARTLHAMSPRGDRSLVVANCTALPETLFENELFGHERGAYTGADRRQEGLISQAEGGTLLMDEMGDLSLTTQAKLLRLWQFKEYRLVGGNKNQKADVRMMAATHRDLPRLVKEGAFREDLYYRLHTLEIRLPALRERMEDLPLLVDHFVALFNLEYGRDVIGFAPSAIARLSAHDWPGNIRELENVVNRSLVMATKRLLEASDVYLEPVSGERHIDFDRPFADVKAEVLEQFERSYLETLLRRTSGNLSAAARQAQHERKSLWRLLKKYDIDPDRFRTDMAS